MSILFSQVRKTDTPTNIILDKNDYGNHKLPNSVTEVSYLGCKMVVYNGCLLTISPICNTPEFPINVFSGLPTQFLSLNTKIDSVASNHILDYKTIKNYYPYDHIPSHNGNNKVYQYFNLSLNKVHTGLERVIGALTVDSVDFLLNRCPKLKAVGVVDPTPLLLNRLKQRNIEAFIFIIDESLNPDNMNH